MDGWIPEVNDGYSDVSRVSLLSVCTLMSSSSKPRTAHAKRLLAKQKLKMLTEKYELQCTQKRPGAETTNFGAKV